MPKEQQDLLRFVTVGSVDDGKSTLIGRLLYETGGVYEDQLAAVERDSARKGGQLDLSLITDGLRAEREQAITIDVAYRYFTTLRRKFIIADTPGHEHYTRNMVTAASTSDLAVILIDARKGILQQTRRHTYLAWLLGIRSIIVAVNKMDLIEFDQDQYLAICDDFMLATIALDSLQKYFVPLCAPQGGNVVSKSDAMPWYEGPTLLDLLENIHITTNHSFRGLRFPVQYVIRPHQDYRGYAGQIVSGSVKVGMEVITLPSQQKTSIEQINLHAKQLDEASPSHSVVLTTSNHVSLGRGDMLVATDNVPAVTQQVIATLIWISATPLQFNTPYFIKHTTQQVCGSVVLLLHKIDIESFTHISANTLHLNDIGVVQLETQKPLFADCYADNRATGSFIVIDPSTNDTVAAGLIQKTNAGIPKHDEYHKLTQVGGQHRGLTVWLTGLSGAGKSTIAKAVYTELLTRGFRVELLDADELRKHLNRDLGFSKEDRNENVGRIGFIADLLTRHGVIVLVAAIAPYRSARDEVRHRIGSFLEIHIDAPLEICEARDPKGLYKKVRQGEIHGFTGIDDPYEKPSSPEVRCDTDKETIRESVEKVLGAVLGVVQTRDARLAGAN